VKINTVIFTGHLGKDPFEQETPKRTITKCTLGVNQGAGKDSIWFDLVCWGRFASEDLLKAAKGDCVTVSGRLVQDKWTGRDGKERLGLGISCETVEVHAGPSTHDIGADERQHRKPPATTVADDDDIPW
tara:strand:- start:8 stop:397 length:390 start_codon:yes stop_codon:yes gene_type:complete